MLHLAHTALGPVECRPPSNRVWQYPEQALVEEIVSAMDLTAEGRPVAARGRQDDAIGLCHLAGHKAATVAGRDDDDRRHRGAAPRERRGELAGGGGGVRGGEPQTGAALAVRGQKNEAPVAHPG